MILHKLRFCFYPYPAWVWYLRVWLQCDKSQPSVYPWQTLLVCQFVSTSPLFCPAPSLIILAPVATLFKVQWTFPLITGVRKAWCLVLWPVCLVIVGPVWPVLRACVLIVVLVVFLWAGCPMISHLGSPHLIVLMPPFF